MPRLPPDHISDFVRMVMPDNASESDLRAAQNHLDDVLDVIERIYARHVRDAVSDCDPPNIRDRVNSSSDS